ncbi:MAG: QueT transporter family protein [Ruminococcus sp.]|nr:QueT transporter family protein [Ruminococcus sp.]
MKNKSILYLAQGAVIAALYIVINYAEAAIFPGSTNMAVQFRVAEALCLLACLTPAAIPGLTVGCFIANFISVGVMPIDLVVGTLASLLAALAMYALRNVKLFTLPVLAALMPAIFNGILVGLEIEIFLVEGGFHFGSFLLTAGSVALGELAVCFILGLPLYKLMENRKLIAQAKTA